MLKILIGFALFGAGFAMLAKTEAILSNLGPIGFFEKYLGSDGGSRLGYKLVGLIFFFFGTILITGLYESFMSWLFGPLTRMISGSRF